MARGGADSTAIDFDDLVRPGLGVTAPLLVVPVKITDELHSWNEMTLNLLPLLAAMFDRNKAPAIQELLDRIAATWAERLAQVGQEEATAYGVTVEFKRTDVAVFRQLVEWLHAEDESNVDRGTITWVTMAAEDYDVLAWTIENEFSK